jgi:transcriptional regulator with XRE-family HTH domain
MTAQTEFGERVRRARRNAGYTQRSVANQLGCSSRTIGDWERGYHTPQPGLFLEFARLVNASTAWLYDGEGPISGAATNDSNQRSDAVGHG